MKRRCLSCSSPDIQFTSLSPGDGRRKMICRVCSHQWTEGRHGGYRTSEQREARDRRRFEKWVRLLRYGGKMAGDSP